MNRLLRILKITTLNVIILIALVSVVDLFIGDGGKAPARNIFLREHRPLTDTYMEPSDSYMKNVSSLEKKEYRLRTDADGFIIGGDEISSDKDSVDIIFFGGSTTECLYVDDSLRFPVLVQKKLSKELNKRIQILNGGVSGNNSMHSTLNLLSKGVPRSPKIVVLMNMVNDVALLNKTGSYWAGPSGRSIVKQEPAESFIKSRARSLKNLLFPNIYNLIVDRMNANKGDEWVDFRNNERVEISKIKREYEKSIRTFVQVAKTHNIRVILMTQFNRINLEDEFILSFQTDIENFKRRSDLCKRFNSIIRKVATSEQVGLIDLESLVPAKSKYLYDAVHLNSAGTELVSGIVSEYLQTNYSWTHN